MSETRKSDYLGDVYGYWTVIARAESGGDRKRRWVVSNGQTEMTVLQTGLNDLALTKKIQEKNAATDADRAARAVVAANHAETQGAFGNVFTLTEAEADLYRRLDNSIAEGQRDARGDLVTHGLLQGALMREAAASVALDNDPECGTYSFPIEGLNPFDDSDCPECGDTEQDAAVVSFIDAAVQLYSDAIVSPSIQTRSSFPADMAGEIARAEADMAAALQDATGDDTLSVVYDKTPLLTESPWVSPVQALSNSLGDAELKVAIDLIVKAKVSLNTAIKNLEDLLNG